MEKFVFKTGRPSIFSEETCNKILKKAAKRLPLNVCAHSAGICYETLRLWLKEGEKDLSECKWTQKSQFFVSLESILGESMEELLNRVEIGDAGWQGSAWILERRWWKKWSINLPVLELNERMDEWERKGNSNGKEMDTGNEDEKGRIA